MYTLQKLPIFLVFIFVVVEGTRTACDESDENLRRLKERVCASLVQSKTSFCGSDFENATANTDWPNQAVYMLDFLDALISNDTCLKTSTTRNLVRWLDETQSNVTIQGNFGWTWKVFQVQYYDMPRKPGTRIESPDTLGRKCWAFAYLSANANFEKLQKVLKSQNLSASKFISMGEDSILLTMNLCEKVMANCFQNSTYTPSRNGTCPLKISEFHYLGFDRENLKRDFVVRYPFF